MPFILRSNLSRLSVVSLLICCSIKVIAQKCVNGDWIISDNLCGGYYKKFDVQKQWQLTNHLQIKAGKVSLIADGVSKLSSNVVVGRKKQVLLSDSALITTKDKNIVKVVIDSPAKYIDDDFIINSKKATFDLYKDVINLSDVHYIIPSINASGHAENIQIYSDHSIAQNVTYTNCAPCDQSWYLKAKTMQLNKNKKDIIIKNAFLYVHSIPIFYIPSYSNVIEKIDRKSGFLLPKISYSKSTSLSLTVPLYINLAPNYDLTINNNYRFKRGYTMFNYFRHISKHSKTDLNLNITPKDLVIEKSRYGYDFNTHFWHPNNFEFKVRYEGTSDDDYNYDFKNNYGEQTYHVRQIEYKGVTNWFNLYAAIQNYKLIRSSNYVHGLPQYTKLPELNVKFHPIELWQNLYFNFNVNNTNFKSYDDINLPEANRLFAEHSLLHIWAFENIEQRVKFSLNYLNYYAINMPAHMINQGFVDKNKSIFHYSVEAHHKIKSIYSVVFSDTLKFLANVKTALLFKPKNFNLNFASFDTTTKPLIYSELFKISNFTGPDRVDKELALAVGVTHDLIVKSKRVGHISLGSKIDLYNKNIYPLATNILINFNQYWSFNFDMINKFNNISFLSTILSYQELEKMKLSIGFNLDKSWLQNGYVRNISLATDFKFTSNIATELSLDYDMHKLVPNKVGIGILYDSCCWNVKLATEYLLRRDNLTQYRDFGFKIGFAFKGLGRLF